MSTQLEPVRPVRIADVSPVPALALLQMIGGYWLTQMIYVAASMGIADTLAAGPLQPAQIAAATGCAEGAVGRLLRCLAGAGVFRALPDGAYEQSPLSELLRSDIPGSLRPLALMNGQEWHWRTWGRLRDAIETEASPFDQIFGRSIYDYLHEQPHIHDTFEQAMSAFTLHSHLLALAAYPVERTARRVVDLGGGYGTLLIHLLRQHPHLTGVLMERPETIAGASAAIAAADLKDRCSCVGGDFFEEVPAGGDLYMLSMVVSDWDDESATRLLGNCRRAMRPGARLIVLQMVLDEPNLPSFAKELDLYCLVMTGGRERTEQEYRRLYELAGFELLDVHPSLSPVRVVEGVAT